VFGSDAIWETFLPMALRYVASSAGAVKAVAADGVAAFFRSCRCAAARGLLAWPGLAWPGLLLSALPVHTPLGRRSFPVQLLVDPRSGQ
jgi:hypothetical protein